MERNITYTEAITALLNDFRQTHDTQLLLDELRHIEGEAGEGELWLRIFEGDTGATSILDLGRFLAAPSHPNF